MRAHLGLTQYKLKIDKFVDTSPTIGFNVERIENKKVAMTIWWDDLAREEEAAI